jgi:hypothetical protein
MPQSRAFRSRKKQNITMTSKELNKAERAERSYPKPIRNNAPAWLAFFVGLAVVIGVFANWRFHPTVPTNVTHAVTATAG